MNDKRDLLAPPKKFLMNRKGDVDLIVWFPRVLMLIFAVLLVIVFVNYFTNRGLPAEDAHIAAFAFRLATDGEIFTYVDPELNRAYPGVIEYSRFTSENVDNKIDIATGDELAQISAEITLRADDCPIIENNLRTIYAQKDTFTRQEAFARYTGTGAAKKRIFRYPVTVRDGETTCPGILRITVVRPNR